MLFTKYIALAFLVVPSFCVTIDNIKEAARNLGDTCTVYKNAASSFPATIGLATPLALTSILAASTNVVVALQTVTLALNNLVVGDVLIAEEDGQVILAGLHVAGPTYIQALNYLVDRRDALRALRVIGGTNALDAVRTDLEGVTTPSLEFKSAMAAALIDQSQVADWIKLADSVIDEEIATIGTLI